MLKIDHFEETTDYVKLAGRKFACVETKVSDWNFSVEYIEVLESFVGVSKHQDDYTRLWNKNNDQCVLKTNKEQNDIIQWVTHNVDHTNSKKIES